MAGATVLAQRPIVAVITLVAGITIGGCALKDIVNVTFCAQGGDVHTSQFESRKIMVKRGRLPGRGGMTDTAVLPKLTIMMVILLMAGKTS